MSDKFWEIGCALTALIVIGVVITAIVFITTYHRDFRGRCTESGGIVTQFGGNGREVCLGQDLKIIEVSQW